MKQVDLPSGMTLKDLLRERSEDREDSYEEVRGIDMGPIKAALEDRTIPLDETPVSRARLIQALMGKYGKGFKTVPAAKTALEHYDREADMIKVIKFNRRKFHG